MNRSQVLCLAAFLACAQGCYRYVTPAYATVTVSASAQSTVSVAYEEPMSQGVWLQDADYGPVWLPSESAASSSLWVDGGLLPRIGALAWSPAVSQWVWLDALEPSRTAGNMIWTMPGAATRTSLGVAVNGVRTLDAGFKPARPLNAVVTVDHVTHSVDVGATAAVIPAAEPVAVRDVLVTQPEGLGPSPIPSAPIAGDIVHAAESPDDVAPVIPMRTSSAPRRVMR